MANLSARAGLTPVETKIPLNNDGVSVIQNFSAYDSQVLYGHVFVNASTPKRSSVRITVTKNGAGDWEVSEAVLSGDDEGGSPLATFAMNGSALQATLPNYAGFVSAYIQYALQAPALGGQFPLSVDGGQVVSGTIDSDRIALATATVPGLYEAGNAPGTTAGTAIAAGKVGEMFGALRSGTGGFTYSVRSTTSPVGSFASVAEVTLNKGVYLISATARSNTNDPGLVSGELRVGGTTVTTASIFQNDTGVTFSGSVTLCVPVIIETDSTVVAFFAAAFNVSTNSQVNEMWAVRIA